MWPYDSMAKLFEFLSINSVIIYFNWNTCLLEAIIESDLSDMVNMYNVNSYKESKRGWLLMWFFFRDKPKPKPMI
jgi:hypothetical protein